MSPSFLPPPLQPPDDPTWLALDACQGWKGALLESAEPSPADGSLTLAVIEGERSLTEPSGSFGGLVAPRNVAVEEDGNLFLLDTDACVLKRYDPCTCAFLTVPCLGGVGAGPRQLVEPHGIALSRGNIVVADTGNARLCVFALHGYLLRGTWSPPPAAALANAWTPYAVASDARGRVYVSDPANGCIHRFDWMGRWLSCVRGVGTVHALAVDCAGRLYLSVAGEEPSIRILSGRGEPVGVTTRVGEIADRFGALPFTVDADGTLDFGAPCGAFDVHGAAVPGGARPARPRHVREGRYVSEALDSGIYDCQWHRVVLCGEIPDGTTVTVLTHTAESAQPMDLILALPDDEWDTWQTARQQSGEWDCLVRSGPGRHLWLQLRLSGTGAATPTIRQVRLDFPRISLRRYLPAVFGEDPVGADFTDRFLGIFDTTLRSIERRVDMQAALFDPRATPADGDPRTGLDFLSWLASWIGITPDRSWPVAKRREMVREAARLYDVRGTRNGLWRLLLVYLGMRPTPEPADAPRQSRCTVRCRPAPENCGPTLRPPRSWEPPPLILEHFQLRRWLFVGEARLGAQAVLWGRSIVNRSQLDHNAQVDRSQLLTSSDPYRDPFHAYASRFSVFVPARIGRTARDRKGLENLLGAESPAQTRYQVEYVEPRFRIGVQSMIGFDAVIGRYPAGVTLGTSSLGGASVLGEPPSARAGPTMRVGSRAQIGTTTRLD